MCHDNARQILTLSKILYFLADLDYWRIWTFPSIVFGGFGLIGLFGGFGRILGYQKYHPENSVQIRQILHK